MIAIDVVLGVLYLFLLLLIARFVADWTQTLARDWRPHGATAAGLELVYSATDPPLRALRRVLPPLRIGSIALDLAFLVVFAVIVIVIQVLGGPL